MYCRLGSRVRRADAGQLCYRVLLLISVLSGIRVLCLGRGERILDILGGRADARKTAYEAITLSAFLLLLMELVALRTSDNDIMDILKDKDKQKLP